jgi:opacity protein-like surface antigen
MRHFRFADIAALAWPLLMAQSAAAAEPGFYVGAGYGRAQQDVEAIDGINVLVSSPFGGGVLRVQVDEVRVDEHQDSWNAVLGYRINSYLSGELAYIDFGEAHVSERYTIPPPSTIFRPAELRRNFTIGVAGPALSALASLPLGHGFEIFLRGGILFADRKVEQQLTSTVDRNTFGSEIGIGGAGVRWSFTDRWAARIEYLRTGNMEENPVTGEGDVDLLALNVLFQL